MHEQSVETAPFPCASIADQAASFPPLDLVVDTAFGVVERAADVEDRLDTVLLRPLFNLDFEPTHSGG